MTLDVALQDPAALAAALDCLASAAHEAGAIALDFFTHGDKTRADITMKLGGSPVTEADLLANASLERNLRTAFPEAGWLSEETGDDADRLSRRVVLVVDPIDGTRGFIAGDPRWAVSVALVLDGRPVVGVVHAPARAETFAAIAGAGATLNGAPIKVADRQDLAGARFGGPKMFAERLKARGLSPTVIPRIPSLAYRLSLLANGELDLFVAKENSHDWDVAAADLLVHEAGGALCTAAGEPLRYNAPDPLHGVLFAAPAPLLPALLEASTPRVAR